MLASPCSMGNPRTEVWHKLDTPGSAPPGILSVVCRQRGCSVCGQAHVLWNPIKFTSPSADRLPQTGLPLLSWGQVNQSGEKEETKSVNNFKYLSSQTVSKYLDK